MAPPATPKITAMENGTTTLRLPDNAAHELRDFLAAHSGVLPPGVWHVFRLLSYAHGESTVWGEPPQAATSSADTTTTTHHHPPPPWRMIMAIRKTRTGRVTHVGRFPHYVYEDRDGVSTLTGITEQVQTVVQITDGPDAGREVVIRLTPAEAEEYMINLQAAIDHARRKQAERI